MRVRCRVAVSPLPLFFSLSSSVLSVFWRRRVCLGVFVFAFVFVRGGASAVFGCFACLGRVFVAGGLVGVSSRG